MRLYDRFLRHGIAPVKGTKSWEGPSWMAETMFGAPVVVADEVVAHYLGEGRRVPVSEMPSLVPPFPVTFVESVVPAEGADRFFDLIRPSVPMRSWGALLQSYDCGATSPPNRGGAANFADIARHYLGKNPDPPSTPARWAIAATLAVSNTTESHVVGPFLTVFFGLQEDGRVCFLADGSVYGFISHPPPLVPGAEDHYDDAVQRVSVGLLDPLLYAVAVMGCRNVKLEEQSGRYTSRQERRAAERRGDPPLTRFYTLKVDPIRRVMRDEGASERTGIKKALHICRRHFATYTEDKPLFGKHAGTFWVPAHVRGSADAGLIGKDYAVKAPKEVAS